MFHVGQKVVCVDDVGTSGLLTKGEIYTVSMIEVFEGCLLVETAETAHLFSPGNGGWLASRFRPVVTTDISIFQAMLVPTPKEKVLVGADDPGIERRG